MHTEHTLKLLDASVTHFGNSIRRFQSVTCPAFNAKELPQEVEARGRRQARRVATGKGKGRRIVANTSHNSVSFNINTYKIHAIGDYVRTIAHLGTMDSYSTRIVSAVAHEF